MTIKETSQLREIYGLPSGRTKDKVGTTGEPETREAMLERYKKEL